MITTNEYGHRLVTVQITLGEDDIAYMQEVIETGEVGVGILEHIVEQYNFVKSKGEINGV
jgi:hypothetical protein